MDITVAATIYEAQRKAIEIAENMLRKNFSIEETAELSGLDIKVVSALSPEKKIKARRKQPQHSN